MNDEEFVRWAEAHNLGEKLRVAIENHVVGRGWKPFNGLELGEVMVKIIHDGSNVRFEALPKEIVLRIDIDQVPVIEKLVNDSSVAKDVFIGGTNGFIERVIETPPKKRRRKKESMIEGNTFEGTKP